MKCRCGRWREWGRMVKLPGERGREWGRGIGMRTAVATCATMLLAYSRAGRSAFVIPFLAAIFAMVGCDDSLGETLMQTSSVAASITLALPLSYPAWAWRARASCGWTAQCMRKASGWNFDAAGSPGFEVWESTVFVALMFLETFGIVTWTQRLGLPAKFAAMNAVIAGVNGLSPHVLWVSQCAPLVASILVTLDERATTKATSKVADADRRLRAALAAAIVVFRTPEAWTARAAQDARADVDAAGLDIQDARTLAKACECEAFFARETGPPATDGLSRSRDAVRVALQHASALASSTDEEGDEAIVWRHFASNLGPELEGLVSQKSHRRLETAVEAFHDDLYKVRAAVLDAEDRRAWVVRHDNHQALLHVYGFVFSTLVAVTFLAGGRDDVRADDDRESGVDDDSKSSYSRSSTEKKDESGVDDEKVRASREELATTLAALTAQQPSTPEESRPLASRREKTEHAKNAGAGGIKNDRVVWRGFGCPSCGDVDLITWIFSPELDDEPWWLEAARFSFAIALSSALAMPRKQTELNVWLPVTVCFVHARRTSSAFLTAKLRMEGTALGAVYGLLVASWADSLAQRGVVSRSLVVVMVFPWIAFMSAMRKHKYGYGGLVAALTPLVIVASPGTEARVALRLKATMVGVVLYMAVALCIFPRRAAVLLRPKLAVALDDLKLLFAHVASGKHFAAFSNSGGGGGNQGDDAAVAPEEAEKEQGRCSLRDMTVFSDGAAAETRDALKELAGLANLAKDEPTVLGYYPAFDGSAHDALLAHLDSGLLYLDAAGRSLAVAAGLDPRISPHFMESLVFLQDKLQPAVALALEAAIAILKGGPPAGPCRDASDIEKGAVAPEASSEDPPHPWLIARHSRRFTSLNRSDVARILAVDLDVPGDDDDRSRSDAPSPSRPPDVLRLTPALAYFTFVPSIDTAAQNMAAAVAVLEQILESHAFCIESMKAPRGHANSHLD